MMFINILGECLARVDKKRCIWSGIISAANTSNLCVSTNSLIVSKVNCLILGLSKICFLYLGIHIK